MQAKLTLSIDKNTIEDAKRYAKEKGKSLSELIENYLKLVTNDKKSKIELSPRIKKLRGSIKLPEDFDYKKELSKSIASKYR